jgi:dTDP-4-dehydrorhamnose 3,5-epimerase
MKRIDTVLSGVCILEPVVHGDPRGYFMETYSRCKMEELGIDIEFVQDNESRSRGGVVRGLHYQLGQPQAKLVRVTEGEVFDVAVDVRLGSPTFGRSVGVLLSGENKRALLVPEGFAHGFCVVSETAQFVYKCSDYYAPAEERGVLWSDPALGIDWPLAGEPLLSEKDQAYKLLAECPAEDLPVYQEPAS